MVKKAFILFSGFKMTMIAGAFLVISLLLMLTKTEFLLTLHG